jgi:hypothetical protein
MFSVSGVRHHNQITQMNPTQILTFVAAAGLVSAARAEVDFSRLPPAAAKKGVTFEKDIKPLFEASCFRCHGEERQKGGLRVDSLKAVLEGGEEGKVVVPGKIKESSLLVSVSGLDPEKAMPPKKKGGPGGPGGRGPGGPGGGPGGPGGPGGGRPPGGPGGGGGFGAPPKDLTPEQVGLVRAWIEQGAK